MTAGASAQPVVVLAFDFGETRIGVAVGNTLTETAEPLDIIVASDNASRWARVSALIDAWTPGVLVVGIPRHPDGAPHDMTARCERFARQLEGRFNRKVACVDERYTSVEAATRVTRKRVDDVAACIILEQFFLQANKQP